MNVYPTMVSALSSASTLQARIFAAAIQDFSWIRMANLAQVSDKLHVRQLWSEMSVQRSNIS